MIRTIPAIIFAILASATATSVHAWKIEPLTTQTDRLLIKRSGFWTRLPTFVGDTMDRLVGEPLHEAFILRVLGCDLDTPGDCFKERATRAPKYEALFAGAQWNDNPPFVLAKTGYTYKNGTQAADRCLNDTIRLPRHPDCWVKAILDAEEVAAAKPIDSSYPLLYRSHYGDLQFLHAMAYGDDTAERTVAKMMLWAEFSYKVARGDISPVVPLDKVPVEGFPALIGIKERPADLLFTLGDPTFRKPPSINWFAFGALLHMVQDTFSDSHVERGEEGGSCDSAPAYRQPGLIKRFHAYDQQDAGRHKVADSRDAFVQHELTVGASAVDVTRNLMDLYAERAEWQRVKEYLTCVFALAPDAKETHGDAGIGYGK